MAHGFTNSVAPAVVPAAGRLAAPRSARSGRSTSAATAGPAAARRWAATRSWRDVDAAVAAARADGADAVVTVGLSMGGGAVLRQAALGRHRPDAVVSVSAVSRWYVRDTRPMRRVHWLLETTPGRRVAVAGAPAAARTSRG